MLPAIHLKRAAVEISHLPAQHTGKRTVMEPQSDTVNSKENGDESLDCPGDTQPVVDKHPQERYTALLVCKYPHPT